MKDEAVSPVAFLMEAIPVAKPSDKTRRSTEAAVARLLEITGKQSEGRRRFLDWLRVEFAVEKPSQKLQDVPALDTDTLIAEVKKARGKAKGLTVAGLGRLREEHARTVAPLQTLAAEARQLERQVSDLVNAAYGLTPDEIALIWRMAPPRMPISAPAGAD